MRLTLVCCLILILRVSAQATPTPTGAPPAITQVGQLGYGSITSYVWSDDGQLLAVGKTNEIRTYRISQPEPIVIPSEKTVEVLVFRHDDRLLASADTEGMVRVWDTTNGKLIATWGYPKLGDVEGMVFMPNSDTLAINFFNIEALDVGSSVATGIWFWEFRTTNSPRIIPTNSYPGESDLVFNPDASRVITVNYSSGNDGLPSTYTTLVRDTASGKMIGFAVGAIAPFRQITFSPTDPDLFVSVDGQGIVSFTQLSTLQEQFALTLPDNLVTTAAFSPDGTQLATGGTDSEVRIWDVATGALLEVYRNQPENVDHLRFETDGTLLAYGTPNSETKIWDARTLKVVNGITMDHITPPILDIAFDATGKIVIGLCKDGTIRAWSVGDNNEKLLANGGQFGRPDFGRSGDITMTMSHDGRLVANLDEQSGMLRLWDIGHGGDPQVLHISPVRGIGLLAFSTDDRRLYLDSSPVETQLDLPDELKSSLRVWPIGADGQLSGETLLLSAELDDLTVSPDQTQIAYWQNDKIHLRDTGSGSETLIALSGDMFVNGLRFTPDGTELVVFSEGQVAFWNSQTATLKSTIRLSSDGLLDWNDTGVDFSPDGRYIAYANGQSLIVIDTLTTMTTQVYIGDRYSYITSLAFSPDGQSVATASNDGSIRLWRVQ